MKTATEKGRKGSSLDREMRIKKIVRQALGGMTHKQIREDWIAEHSETHSIKTWERDYAAALTRIRDINQQYLDYTKDLFLARYDSLYEKSVEDNDIKTAADITAKTVKLLGLDQETHKVEVTTPDTITISFNGE